MSKMNPEVKALWVAALRSGEYAQGKDHLRIGNSFCCLGVLCDLHREHAPAPLTWKNLYDARGTAYGDEGDTGLPPGAVSDWAWVMNPRVRIGKNTAQLSYHNDILSASFAEIADAIEEQL